MKVLVFGTFDRLHPGHEFVLRSAAKRGKVFVVVARDQTVERIKGHLPDQSEIERLEAVRHRAPAADVRLGSVDEYLQPVRDIQPDLILLGYDQQLPPGVHETDLPCPVERLPAYEPKRYKSSLRRREKGGSQSR